MKTIKCKTLVLAVASTAIIALSGCVHHNRIAMAVEGIDSLKTLDELTATRNKYYIDNPGAVNGPLYACAMYSSKRKYWSRTFAPLRTSFLGIGPKQEGIPIKVEFRCNKKNNGLFPETSPQDDRIDVLITVNGECFSDDPPTLIKQYDYCSSCGETEYKPGTPNCSYRQLDSALCWWEYTWWYWYGWSGYNGSTPMYPFDELCHPMLAAIAKKLKELEDDGVIPIQ